MESRLMNNDSALPEPSFAMLKPSRSGPAPVDWYTPSNTTLAHATGRLHALRSANAWQPVAGPGSLSNEAKLSPTLQSLHRRAVRGEA